MQQPTSKAQSVNKEIEIYTGANGVELAVQLEEETVWLTLDQLSTLFERDKSTISRHIKNVFNEGELEQNSVVANFATTAADGKTYQVDYYNLDVIISVGYRVKSLQGTQFRQWATRVLNNHLVQGYTINQQRLDQLNQVLSIATRALEPETAGIAELVQRYLSGLTLLEAYDNKTLTAPKGHHADWELTYAEARAFIDALPFGQGSDLFGQERGDAFKGILGALYQSFDGQDLYSTAQEKAANLLYLVIKDHPFADGNKRSAAGLFVYFLDKNDLLQKADGTPTIESNALAAITLMIALSHPMEKDLMCALVMNMLDKSF
ncbi:MAG: virulence RhuM family protein [Coriobacteriia bacterium]|nr:virulence RhuM family protein [Coriobacteriia bacterium]